jgi:DNA-3-methyladenine glycosylase
MLGTHLSVKGFEDLVGPASEVAPFLLGARFVTPKARGIIAEVEAYEGSNDPASHAFRGVTKRNRIMFFPAGYLYVYLCYGMHYMANVVVGPEGEPGAVLIRAIIGHDGTVINGPGRVTRYLGITVADDGQPLDGALSLELPSKRLPGSAIETGARIGIKRGTELMWRFRPASIELIAGVTSFVQTLS